jgi:MFS family permease
MTSPTPSIHRAWLVVGLLWVVALLNYLDRNMLTTMRASVVEAIPMTDAQFGLLTSVFLWIYGFCSPFAGYLADKLNRVWIIIGSLFVWSAVTWLTGHARTFEQLLAARALMGISEACYIPAALALIADYHRGSTRSLATGIHMSGIFVGSGLGGLGGWLADVYGWGHAFSLFGMIGIVYSFVLITLLRETPRESEAQTLTHQGGLASAFSHLFKSGPFWRVLLYWGLLGVCGWALSGWLPTYLGDRFQLSQGAAGLSATGYLQAAALVGVVLSGVLADRWSRRNERGRIFIPVIGMIIAAPGVFLAANTDTLAVAIFGLIIYGLARASADTNMMPILCLVVDSRYRATAYGVLNLFSCVIGGVAIYAGGAMRDADIQLSRLFQIAAFSLLGCAYLLYSVKTSKRA